MAKLTIIFQSHALVFIVETYRKITKSITHVGDVRNQSMIK